ncbi:MAG: hypothetical protein ACHREM_20320 [Polyangiales bacterium]
MRIKIDTEIPFPKWARGALLMAVGGLVVGVGMRAFASPPNWTSGETLTAAGLTQLSVATAGTASYSVGATVFVGITSGTHTGNLLADPHAGTAANGYQAAANICRAEVTGATPTIHMCTAEEIMRTAALGMPMPQQPGVLPAVNAVGRFSTMVQAPGSGSPAADCTGWTGTTGAAAVDVSYAGASGGGWAASTTSCGSAMYLLCCD